MNIKEFTRDTNEQLARLARTREERQKERQPYARPQASHAPKNRYRRERINWRDLV